MHSSPSVPAPKRRSEVLRHPHQHLNRRLQQHQFLPSTQSLNLHLNFIENASSIPRFQRPTPSYGCPSSPTGYSSWPCPSPSRYNCCSPTGYCSAATSSSTSCSPAECWTRFIRPDGEHCCVSTSIMYCTDTIAFTPYNHPLLLYTASCQTSTLILICSKRSTLTNTTQQRCSSWLIYRPCHRRLFRRWLLRTR